MKSLSLLSSILVLALASTAPAMAQKPGAPYPGFPSPNPQILIEPSDGAPGTTEPAVIHSIGAIVNPGYLILVDVRGAPYDPTTWSDVIAFESNPSKPGCGPYETAGTAVLVSSAPGSTGITDANLAQIPAAYSSRVTVAEITGLFGSGCVAIVAEDPSGGPTVYTAGDATYTIYSAPDLVTPTAQPSWGRLKLVYR